MILQIVLVVRARLRRLRYRQRLGNLDGELVKDPREGLLGSILQVKIDTVKLFGWEMAG
jgi:hypothetical protein